MQARQGESSANQQLAVTFGNFTPWQLSPGQGTASELCVFYMVIISASDRRLTTGP